MRHFLLIIFIGIISWSCTDSDDPVDASDGFDRQAMLINWADNIIIPAYDAYNLSLAELSNSTNSFTENPSLETLTSLRSNWEVAYTSWQTVSMFEIGKAEELTLRDFTNVYPTNTGNIDNAISSGSYNLTLPSTRSQQGFPAINYLIHGLGTDQEIVDLYTSSESHKTYLNDLVNRLATLTGEVLADWQGDYRQTFVDRDGSDASSSVNKLINDFMFYYEKALRAGKVGIPAGIFSNTSLPDRIESLHQPELSKSLLQVALTSAENFFNGVHFDDNDQGMSLSEYLDFVNAISEGETLSRLINQQFESAQSAINGLDGNLMLQVETDNTSMLKAYDELQKNVVLMKVDMFQALNIKVDFVDADGD